MEVYWPHYFYVFYQFAREADNMILRCQLVINNI